MTDDDFDAFAEAWGAAYEMTGNGKLPTGRAMNMAFDVLQGFDLSRILKALSAHVRDPATGQFQPKPADIVRYLDGTPDDAAMEAWAKVDHALRRIGYGPHLVFDDPKIHRVLSDMGGFAQFGSATEKDLTFLRQQFCKQYASCRDVSNYPPKIAGWHTDGQTRMIGDPERCQKVLEGGAGERLMISNAADVATKLIEGMG